MSDEELVRLVKAFSMLGVGKIRLTGGEPLLRPGFTGLINSITQPFCGNCSRARATADGMLYTCLFTGKGTALGPMLREHGNSRTLENFIRKRWAGRDDRYSEIRHLQTGGAGGQEMYRMSG